MGTASSRKLTHIPAIDGLRAIAIVMVMLHHAQIPPKLFDGGRGGVDVFFVISGFLITSLLVNEYDRDNRLHLAEFYKRRAVRLLPAMYVMLIGVVAYAAITSALHGGAEVRSTLNAAGFALIYASNWALAFGADLPITMWHLWSLAVEEQFYLVAPLAFALMLPRLSRRWIMALLLAAAGVGVVWRAALVADHASRNRVRFGLDAHADGLLIGCVLGVAFASGLLPKLFAPSARKRIAGPVVLVALGLSTVAIGNPRWEEFWVPMLHTALGLLAVWSVIGEPGGLHVRVLTHPVVQHIGRISYALYLWHSPVEIYTYRAMGLDAPLVARVAVTWAISVALAEASMRLIEAPAQRWRKRRAQRAVLDLTEPGYQSVGA